MIQYPALSAIFQFLVLKSENRLNGFSPFIEFKFPWIKERTKEIYMLVGFAASLSYSVFAFNQVLHYSPSENIAEGNFSFSYKISRQVFFVSEVSGLTEKGSGPIYNLLGGVKLKLNDNFIIGLAYQLPLTNNRDFSAQYIFQLNTMCQDVFSKYLGERTK